MKKQTSGGGPPLTTFSKVSNIKLPDSPPPE